MTKLCCNAYFEAHQFTQQAQSHCDIFRRWGAKSTDQTYNKSFSQTNPQLTKKLTETLSEEYEGGGFGNL